MKARVSHAIVIDNNDLRRVGFVDELRRCAVEVDERTEVIDVVAPPVLRDALLPLATGFASPDLLLLVHLGPTEARWRFQRSGNQYAMEMLMVHKELLKNKCVIAYSGGNDRPREFAEICDEGWHEFIPNVQHASGLNLGRFLRAWNRHPTDPPPLKRLASGRSPALLNFMGRIVAYQNARRAVEPVTLGIQEIVQPGSWASFFKTNRDELFDELNDLEESGQAGLLPLATKLQAWFDGLVAADIPMSFDKCLHQALMDAQPWPTRPDRR